MEGLKSSNGSDLSMDVENQHQHCSEVVESSFSSIIIIDDESQHELESSDSIFNIVEDPYEHGSEGLESSSTYDDCRRDENRHQLESSHESSVGTEDENQHQPESSNGSYVCTGDENWHELESPNDSNDVSMDAENQHRYGSEGRESSVGSNISTDFEDRYQPVKVAQESFDVSSHISIDSSSDSDSDSDWDPNSEKRGYKKKPFKRKRK